MKFLTKIYILGWGRSKQLGELNDVLLQTNAPIHNIKR